MRQRPTSPRWQDDTVLPSLAAFRAFIAPSTERRHRPPYVCEATEGGQNKIFVFAGICIAGAGNWRFNLETAVGRCEVHSVSEISRLGCIRLGRGGAGRGG